jgi:hypothetical protein
MTELGMTEGFDVGLEMSGAEAAFNQMLDSMNHGGRIAVLGIPAGPMTLDVNDVIFKGLNIQGIYGRRIFETWYKMAAMLQSGLDVERHRHPPRLAADDVRGRVRHRRSAASAARSSSTGAMSLFTRPGRPIRSPLPLPLFGADCGVGFGRMLVVAAVALSSTFVVAGTSPVVADEAPVAQTAALLDPATMTAEELATAFPDEFAFLSAEYGLTPAGAADALRLTWEAGSTREWAMGSVSGYAGTWVDYRKGTVFVGVAGGSRGMKDAQRSLASAPSSAAARTALIGRQRPMSTLLSDARLLAIAADPLDTGSVYVQIDEQRNQLVVVGMSAERAQQLPAVTRLVRGAGYSPVEFRAAEVAAPTDVRGGWDGKQGAGCTMAFTVVNPANERGVLTAGHCADNQVSASGVTLSEAQFDRSFWATGAADYGYDRQLHLVPAGTKTVGSLQVPSVSISGSFLPAVGSVVCRYGASSVGKGQSTAFCSTVSGYGYDGFVGMRHGCIYGDSGGPMWVLGKAVGIAAVTTDPTWPVDAIVHLLRRPSQGPAQRHGLLPAGRHLRLRHRLQQHRPVPPDRTDAGARHPPQRCGHRRDRRAAGRRAELPRPRLRGTQCHHRSAGHRRFRHGVPR